ncbi:unnamed protein product, partial [Adineta steineri]
VALVILHLCFFIKAPASYAQAHIWLDEQIRFHPEKPQVAIYNTPFVYRLYSNNTVSIRQLRYALELTVFNHESLHTSLVFDTENKILMQQVIIKKEHNNNFFPVMESTYETDEQLNEVLHDEKRNPHLFDLGQGRVFRCHIIYYKQISLNDLLSDKDLLIFNFHHALFDFASINIFLHDLNQAYTTSQLSNNDNTNLRYLDYAVIEQQMSMTGASMFWLDALHDCKLDQPLSLPFDRYRLSNEHRSARGTSISFDLGQDLSHDFLIYASSNNISLEHLTFAIYFIFLFKLTNGQTDLCVAMNINNNRYRDELKSVIGLFESVIPLRCQLDPHWCFHQSLEHVQEVTKNSMKYSYFPLQRILNQHPHISKHAFLNTSLEFISYNASTGNNTIVIGDSQIVPASFSFKSDEDEILILPNERCLMQSLNNTQISFSSPLTCIHHEFVYQVMKHPQKLAVELDEQSLTYCELLYYVQVLSSTLLNEYDVFPGEIVCQCVERSLLMVIGIMGIEMAGGVYCALSPRDSQHRLHALTQQTQSRLVLVHRFTINKVNDNIISVNIDLVWASNDMNSDTDLDQLSNVPIGSLLANYQCKVFDIYLQSVAIGEEAELFVGGAGVFAGYLGRDDLTAKALLEIDGQLFYRTGDLVRIGNNGLIHYQGRKDHQIKSHGQRIELGEIERSLLNITSISACVVIKWNDDYLVAYVQSSDTNEQELREHCQSHLPPHMIPSIFVILDNLPLNANGKIDRKQLPSPIFSSTQLSSYESDTPLNKFEERVHTIWCQVLHSNENQISATTSFFSAGGHSLCFIELYYRYQSLFSFDAHSLSIGLFLQQPTIRQHAQLLQTLPSNDTQTTQWQSLHINQGKTFLN